jgi:hypothetical protein
VRRLNARIQCQHLVLASDRLQLCERHADLLCGLVHLLNALDRAARNLARLYGRADNLDDGRFTALNQVIERPLARRDAPIVSQKAGAAVNRRSRPGRYALEAGADRDHRLLNLGGGLSQLLTHPAKVWQIGGKFGLDPGTGLGAGGPARLHFGDLHHAHPFSPEGDGPMEGKCSAAPAHSSHWRSDAERFRI